MLSLSYIQGIDDDAVELLKTVGVEDATLLSQFTPQTLATLLRSKNGADALPSHQVLEDWISQAELISSTLSGGGEEPEADSDVEVVEAVELDEEDIADAEVAELAEEDDFDDIPEVVVLEEDDEAGGIHVVELPNKPYHKDEELAYWRKVRGLDSDFGAGAAAPEEDDIWKEVDPSSFSSFDNYRDGKVGVKPLVDEDDEEEMERIKRLKHRTNEKTAKPDFGDKGTISRWVRRGVQHPAPMLVWITGVFVVLARLYVVAVVLFLPFAVIELGDQFRDRAKGTEVDSAAQALSPGMILQEWWWLIFGILLLIIWMYLWSAVRVRCRVCSCHFYYSSRAYKHVKAHNLRPMGFVFSLALHAVLFRWFRCMYCGTAIRLWESDRTQKEQTMDAPALDVADDE